MKWILQVSLILTLFTSCNNPQKKPKALPYFGNYDIVFSETNGVESIDTVYPKIPAFAYLNQDSVMITSKSMKGKVWIANFFFTSCPSICPPMISQMKRLNLLTQDLAPEVQFMSFSIDPKTDQPHVLRTYIKNNGIQTKNWYFFTGDEAKTHRLGVKHFMVHADKDPMAAGGFAHSDGLVLVDREGYVRGVYRGTQTEDVNRLNSDLRKLLDIEYGIKTKH
ncbi:SCO family protein [Fluviicola sp.]|jgi:protein SCO1/2|uniref:SCO family protein n=1 Tax=Fluviicola sp. TaxID=1917219 RepID=UPI0028175C23|nr:SCO family protein [Fluviicola sp.]MDR0801410.1 SCO family protein [Fluviicola sp.]